MSDSNPVNPKIYISYRRADSAYVTGMLAEELQANFGNGSVFLDIDNIPFGVDFRQHIDGAVGDCDIFLAIIGDNWIDAKSVDGRRRIESGTDFVRFEIETALKRGIPVVPVLVDNALMPEETELPESLRSLVYRNAAELRPGRDLKHHINILIHGIRLLSEESAASSRINAQSLDGETSDHAESAARALAGREFDSTPGVRLQQRAYAARRSWLPVVFLVFLLIGIVLFSIAIFGPKSMGPGEREFWGVSSFYFFGGAGLAALTWICRRIMR